MQGATDGDGINSTALRGYVQFHMFYKGPLEALGARGKWKLFEFKGSQLLTVFWRKDMFTNSTLQKGSLRLYFKVTSVVLTAKQSWAQEVYQTPGSHHERSASDSDTESLRGFLFTSSSTKSRAWPIYI